MHLLDLSNNVFKTLHLVGLDNNLFKTLHLLGLNNNLFETNFISVWFKQEPIQDKLYICLV